MIIKRPSRSGVGHQDRDWILVGERNLKALVLTLDDWVVALRARFIHGEEEPKVERLWQEPPPPLLSVRQE